MENILTESILNRFYFEQYKVQIVFKHDYEFGSYHGVILNGLLSEALNKANLRRTLLVYPFESGKVHYKEGVAYHFGITILGKSEDIQDRIVEGIKKVAAMPLRNETINGAFKWVRMDKFQNSAFGETFLDEINNEKITIYFVTPSKIAKKDNCPGDMWLTQNNFDPTRIFELLYLRLAKDILNMKIAFKDIPPVPACRLIKKDLRWVDVQYSGKTKTFGGVVGNVQFKAELDPFWKKLLWLGQYIHVGKFSAKSFGKYIIY